MGEMHFTTSESQVVEYCRCLLRDLIASLTLNTSIELRTEFVLAAENVGVERNLTGLLVLYNKQKPIGIVQVKNPPNKSKEELKSEREKKGKENKEKVEERQTQPSSSRLKEQEQEQEKEKEKEKEKTIEWEGKLNPNLHAGQIGTYMYNLQKYFKVKSPIGILTTFEEWYFCVFKGESQHIL